MLLGLTGKSGMGKTQLCLRLIAEARKMGWNLFGFYCPAIFKNGVKTGIEVRLLPGEEKSQLADSITHEGWLEFGRWWMNPEAFSMVNRHLERFTGTDVLICDEIGPAETEKNMGWPKALHLLKQERYRLAVVSFRPALQNYFLDKFPRIQIINLEEDRDLDLSGLLGKLCKLNSHSEPQV